MLGLLKFDVYCQSSRPINVNLVCRFASDDESDAPVLVCIYGGGYFSSSENSQGKQQGLQ